MRIAACQFGVSGSIADNLETIARAMREAAANRAALLVCPECALTGYPPRNIASAAAVDFDAVNAALRQLQALSDKTGVALIVGAVVRENGLHYNRALVLRPGAQADFYDKRALWGWDRDNFAPGAAPGVFALGGLRVGVRICFEVRFPEYFRALYRATDLNIVLFYDVADAEDTNRYNLIRGHLQTRAVENVCPILSVNATRPHQTAPTCLIDASGRVLHEQPRGAEGLMICNFIPKDPDFGKRGRLSISDRLTGACR